MPEAFGTGQGEGKRFVLSLNSSLDVSDVDQVSDKGFENRRQSCCLWFPCHPNHMTNWTSGWTSPSSLPRDIILLEYLGNTLNPH